MTSLSVIWALITGVLLLFVAWRTHHFTRSLRSLKDVDVPDSNTWRKVSIVIPACNEAAAIEPAVRSLLALEYPALEIVIVDDRSTDGTGEIIDRLAEEDARIKPLHITHLPEGWLGKVHAIHEGIQRTSGRWILISDADVQFEPHALKKAIHFAFREQLDFLTVIPDVKTRGLGLQMMMSQFCHQASLYIDPLRLNDPAHRICYGQGAFLLLRRDVFERSEGLEWLKMEAIDDTGLALLMRRAGARMGVIAGQGEIRLEWYRDLASFVRGIEKNAFAIVQYRVSIWCAVFLSTLLVFFGFTLAPILCGSWEIRLFVGGALALYLICVRLQFRSLLRVPLAAVLLFPISFLCLPLLFARAGALALWRGGIRWRETFYPLKSLRENQRVKLANFAFTPSENSELSAEQLKPKS